MKNILAVFLLLAIPALSVAGTVAPLPDKLVHAKTLFIQNRASAKAYDNTVDEFQKWGRFQIVSSPDSADIVLVLSADEVAWYTHFEFVDPATNTVIWSDSRAWGRYKSTTRQMVKNLKSRMGD